jgi:hypothetical protein
MCNIATPFALYRILQIQRVSCASCICWSDLVGSNGAVHSVPNRSGLVRKQVQTISTPGSRSYHLPEQGTYVLDSNFVSHGKPAPNPDGGPRSDLQSNGGVGAAVLTYPPSRSTHHGRSSTPRSLQSVHTWHFRVMVGLEALGHTVVGRQSFPNEDTSLGSLD